ncbi:peptidyl-prolyl cis-trans isomerase SurA [Thermonema lapsum]|uniref:Peptidyl-prolyl cis-trans isomerase SurA n=1 Tax=Thermonema lapsum TaxID=28195 RepID=A0A846MRY7_9BACT|nr:peptidylprolyl isomerase [Thermonema lapsum]NIK74219.1 peptidyl-prolyl cis-trans isomerase SurA [Thermonema lapsum]
MKTIIKLCFSLAFSFVLFFTCHLTTLAQQQVLDKIIARVDDYIILQSDLELYFEELVEDGRLPRTPQAKCQLLQSMVVNKMLLAKAEIDSVTVSDQLIEVETEQRIDALLQGRSPKVLEELYGKSFEDLKRELQQSLKEERIAQTMRSKITEGIGITPAEVKRYFKRLPKDSIPIIPTEFEVAQIVRVLPLKEEERQRVKEQLETIRKRIVEDGEAFEKLAKIYGQDGTRDFGGDLGWQRRGNLVPEFEAVVFRLKPGEVSRVFETPFGFHIVKLEERRGDEFRCRHILIIPDWSKVEKEQEYRFLDSLRRVIQVDSLTFEKAAIQFSQDKGVQSLNTAANGGYFMSRKGAYRIPDKELDAYLYRVLDTMKVGTISKPMEYRMPDGKRALRIIYFKAKYPAHFASLETDFDRIAEMALEEKKNKVLNEWFLKAKDELYIHVAPEYRGCQIFGAE